MAKVRRLAEDLQMPNHSPGCVEGGIKVISTQIRVYSHSNIVDVFLCIPKIHAYFAVFRAD